MARTITFDDMNNSQYREHHSLEIKNNTFKKRQSKLILDTQVLGFNEFGEKLFDEDNQLVLNGSLFYLCKAFGVDFPINISTLNEVLNINKTESDPAFSGLRRENIVSFFTIGNGGAGDSLENVKKVKYCQREVDGIIPFRYTNTGLSEADKDRYFLDKDMGNGYHAFYGKKFETTAVIKCQYRDGSPVPPNAHENGNEDINTFIELNMKISSEDVREYYEHNGGISASKINTIGLIAGYPEIVDQPSGKQDMKGCRTISIVNFENEALSNISKEINIIYRIYI